MYLLAAAVGIQYPVHRQQDTMSGGTHHLLVVEAIIWLKVVVLL